MRSPLFLTFDDGPDPVWTPRVVDLLGRYGATATFFVLGWRVREAPELVGQLLAAGHRVELHGDAHLDHEVATPEQLTTDTADALAVLRDAGAEPQWWRIPFGRPSLMTGALAEEHGLRLAGWDVDTHDWRGDGWAYQPAQVSDAAETGGVVLLHDAVVPGVGRTAATNTLEIVEALLSAAARAKTPVLALPPAADTSYRISSGPPRSPFGRNEASQNAWRRLDRWRRGDGMPEQPGGAVGPDERPSRRRA